MANRLVLAHATWLLLQGPKTLRRSHSGSVEGDSEALRRCSGRLYYPDCELKRQTLEDLCLPSILQLEAKWLLEHQLAMNKARREREAAETELASKKRKLDSAAEEDMTNARGPQTEETSAKRIKVQHSPAHPASPSEKPHVGPPKDAKSLDAPRDIESVTSRATKPVMTTGEESGGQNGGQPANKDTSQAALVQDERRAEVAEIAQDKAAAPPPEESKEQKEQLEQLEHADQTANEEDMNFESMFGDANVGDDQNNDLSFDMDLNSANLVGSNPFDSTSHEANNLELLPGLASYANASGDDFSMLNLPASSKTNQIPPLEKEFDLPEIQGDSSFNDLFADGDFGGDASLMDLDLENGFFDN
jgi:hypothetical protein